MDTKQYPCDLTGICPFEVRMTSSGEFCRTNCGLSDDESTVDVEPECNHIWEYTEIVNGKVEWPRCGVQCRECGVQCRECGKFIDIADWERMCDEAAAEFIAEEAKRASDAAMQTKHIVDILAENIGPDELQEICDYLMLASTDDIRVICQQISEVLKELE